MNNEYIVSVRKAIRHADGTVTASQTGVDVLMEKAFGRITINEDAVADIDDLLEGKE